MITVDPPFEGRCTTEVRHILADEVDQMAQREDFPIGPGVFCPEKYDGVISDNLPREEWEAIVNDELRDEFELYNDDGEWTSVPIEYAD